MGIIDDRLAVIQPLNKFWYGNKVASIDMLRLDKLHPIISGNKWYKLRLNLLKAQELRRKTIITFGGGYSNHLVATAYAASQYGLASVGIVRGHYAQLTPTLEQCKSFGMELLFVNQEDFDNRHQPEWITNLATDFDNEFIIPEGGANEYGRKGAALINRFINNTYSHVLLAVGTGTTMAGILQQLPTTIKAIGYVPMKQCHEQHNYIAAHIESTRSNWHLITDDRLGNFGKWNHELIAFMNRFYEEHNIPLDVVYTSRMMYKLEAMLEDNQFSTCDRILCIHSGGLQGNASVAHLLKYGINN